MSDELTFDGNDPIIAQDPEQVAAPSGAEDTAYLDIIASQNATIAELQTQLKQANDNLAKAIRQGAAFVADESKNPEPKAASASDAYTYLKDLDFSISKKDFD